MRPISIGALVLGLLFGLSSSVNAADEATVALGGTRVHFSMAEPIEFAVLYKNDGGNAKTMPIGDPSQRRQHGHDRRAVRRPGRQVAGPHGHAARQRAQARRLHGRRRAGRQAKTRRHSPWRRDEHPNAYMIAQWVQHTELPGTIAAKGGWMYFSSDFHSLHPRKPTATDAADAYVAARMKPFALCVFGGGHQLDLDLHNDWGDPWVQRSIAWRMQLNALSNRIYPIAGLHCFDEPGLTWWPTQAGRRRQGRHQPVRRAAPARRVHRSAPARSCRKGRSRFTGPKFAEHMDDWSRLHGAAAEVPGTVVERDALGDGLGESEIRHDQPGVEQLRPRRHDRRRGRAAGPGLRRAVRPRRLQRQRLRHDVPGALRRGIPGIQPGQAALLPADVGRDGLGLPRNGVWMSWITKLEGIEYPPGPDYSLAGGEGGYDGTNSVFEIAEINRRLALVGDVMRQIPEDVVAGRRAAQHAAGRLGHRHAQQPENRTRRGRRSTPASTAPPWIPASSA